jgi:hypothetical protein
MAGEYERREVRQLRVEGEGASHLLPVVSGDGLVGVVGPVVIGARTE